MPPTGQGNFGLGVEAILSMHAWFCWSKSSSPQPRVSPSPGHCDAVSLCRRPAVRGRVHSLRAESLGSEAAHSFRVPAFPFQRPAAHPRGFAALALAPAPSRTSHSRRSAGRGRNRDAFRRLVRRRGNHRAPLRARHRRLARRPRLRHWRTRRVGLVVCDTSKYSCGAATVGTRSSSRLAANRGPSAIRKQAVANLLAGAPSRREPVD